MSDSNTNGKQFNKIYIIGGINEENTCEWLKAIDKAELEALNKQNEIGVEVPLVFEISSWGGNLNCAFGLSDRIARLKVPTITTINGYAMSAGSVISMASDWRQMSKNSFFLIHQYSWSVQGTHEIFKDNMEAGDKFINTLINFYIEHSNLSRKKIKKLLKRDKWLTAQECLKYGFVDEIV